MMVLSQQEADTLIAMDKRSVSSDSVHLPYLGGQIQVPLVSLHQREEFILDVRWGRINLRKGTKQLRAQQVIVLLRLDYNGPPHRNPDDTEIGGSHLHHYREGYADKWAVDLPEGVFSNLNDHWQTLHDFMEYCSVKKKPNFRKEIFT